MQKRLYAPQLPVVLSNADPHVTFLQLVEPAALAADFRRDIAHLRMRWTKRQRKDISIIQQYMLHERKNA